MAPSRLLNLRAAQRAAKVSDEVGKEIPTWPESPLTQYCPAEPADFFGSLTLTNDIFAVPNKNECLVPHLKDPI